MNRKHRTARFSGHRAAVAAACICITLMLSGCNAVNGALLGGWFGAVAGGTTEAVLTGAFLGAVIGQEIDRDYGRREPREWYRPCECPACTTGRYDY